MIRKFTYLFSVMFLAACGVVAPPDPTEVLQGAVVPTRAPTLTPAPTATAMPSDTSNQTNQLTYGNVVSGSLNPSVAAQEYTFEGQVGDVVSIRMTREEFAMDPVLSLIGPNDSVVAENDDSPEGGTLDAFIDAVSLTETGTYRIRASQFAALPSERVTGAFSLSLDATRADEDGAPQQALIAAAYPAATGLSIEIGDEIEGEITDSNYAILYTFEGLAGQSIDLDINAFGETMDPYVVLLAPDGRVLARNDDFREGQVNAALRGINLTEDGFYTVVATRYRQHSGESTGTFTLSVEETNDASAPTATSRLIRYGVSQTGVLDNEQPEVMYTFQGSAGDMIDLRMTNQSDNLDPSLLLTDAIGNALAVNDDINTLNNFDAAIENFVLPEDGYYSITASRYQGTDGDTFGEYELDLSRVETEVQDIRYAYLDDIQSKSLLDGEEERVVLPVGFFVGDRYWEPAEADVPIQTLLTFQLPHLEDAQQIETATLILDRCVVEGMGFDAIRQYQVIADAFGIPEEQTPFEPGAEAEQVAELDTCDNVQITAQVQNAYQTNQTQIQFRLRTDDLEANEQSDAIVFTDPRLMLEFVN